MWCGFDVIRFNVVWVSCGNVLVYCGFTWRQFSVVCALRGVTRSSTSFMPRYFMQCVFPRRVLVSHGFSEMCFPVVWLFSDVVLPRGLLRQHGVYAVATLRQERFGCRDYGLCGYPLRVFD